MKKNSVDKINITTLQKDMSNNSISGFTLLELLVVVAIVGILTSLAVPVFLEYQAAARDARRITTGRNVFAALEGYYIDNQEYPPNPSPGRACSPQDGHGFYNVDCLSGIYPFFSEQGLKEALGSTEIASANNLYYYNYGDAPQGAIVNIRLEKMSKPNPCVFPTGSWCSSPNGVSYCLCTGKGN